VGWSSKGREDSVVQAQKMVEVAQLQPFSVLKTWVNVFDERFFSDFSAA
jgi:hypothetical protein